MIDLSDDDITQLRRQGDLPAVLRQQLADAQAATGRNRKLVLAQPETAARLTEPPLSYDRSDQWTGYIPPAHLASGAVNTSPIRAALLALVKEAEQRTEKRRPAA